MAYYKFTHYFRHPIGGWSESYYHQDNTMDEAVAANIALADVRAQLTGEKSDLFALRTQDEVNPRISRLTNYRDPQGLFNDQSDNPTTTYRCVVQSAQSAHSRQMYLRGNPDAVYDTQDPNNPIATQWKAIFDTFWKPIFQPPTGVSKFFIKYKVGKRTGEKKTVFNYAASTVRGKVKVTLPVGDTSGVVPGNLVTFYQMPGLNPGPGLSRVVETGLTNEFYVARQIPANYTYSNGGFYILYQFGYEPITTLDFRAFGEHRVGGFFGRVRGARRKTQK